jgi:shikimate kinase
MVDCLVLLGPPGSGKSYLGELLARRFALEWTEHERLLLLRWGSREAFVANKVEALAFLESDLRRRILAAGRTVVFESTGVSDRPMLERLLRERRVAIVKLVVPQELCARRVSERPAGRHLTDDPVSAATFHDWWTREVAPGWRADLDVVNDAEGDRAGVARTEGIVQAVADLLGA